MTDMTKVTQQDPLMVKAVIEKKVVAKEESNSVGLDTQDYAGRLRQTRVFPLEDN